MLILLTSRISVVILGEVMLHYGASRLLGRHGLGRALDRIAAQLLCRLRRQRQPRHQSATLTQPTQPNRRSA